MIMKTQAKRPDKQINTTWLDDTDILMAIKSSIDMTTKLKYFYTTHFTFLHWVVRASYP